MSVTDEVEQGVKQGATPAVNDLYRLAAVGGLLLALFFFAGAWGHLRAVWPMAGADGGRLLGLLLPGLVLAAMGLLNALCIPGLWCRRSFARRGALLVNGVATAYLAYLLAQGVPGHPIGIFLLLASSQLMLLAAIAGGLVWPSPPGVGANDDHSADAPHR
ncbi:hypothetical protein L1F30_11565 [Simiduia sp. 21SJ11W-1]|uniref:hypothetical protein n=1 Tax=Simiduia sp. 21SJ11W-1 TaxID=2909669 RepID=UPI0020A177AE|nr:hypothetical protein [Simiduia sp. 21SJ11W-1]UTA46797.1 hypothetical protein L1F30_11565 [Simiduia sp. 21SJ11W-1]